MKYVSIIVILIAFIAGTAKAQTSNADGEWLDAIWTGGTPASNYVISGTTIYIHNVVTSNAALDLVVFAGLEIGGDGDADIDSLIIEGTLSSEILTSITIHQDGVLVVNGDLTNGFWGGMTVDGQLEVDGNLTNGFGGNITVGNTGIVAVDGDVDNNGGFTNNGTVQSSGTIDGVTGGTQLPGVQNPLPVELTFFYANIVDGRVQFIWETATELNNDYFSIEKSFDGENFWVIDDISGAGTTNEVQNYTHYDNYLENGTTYYRLKQTDYNGEFSYSDIVSVYSEVEFFNLTQALVYPTLIENDSKIHVDLTGFDRNAEIQVSIIGIDGKVYFTNSYNYNVSPQFNIDTDFLNQNETYIVNILANGFVENVKVVKR